MMNNLFSPFDPSNFSLQMGWSFFMIPMMVMNPKSSKSSKQSIITLKMMSLIIKDLNEIMLKSKMMENVKISLTTFMIISTLNIWSLIPSSFTMTAQISMNLPTAISMWSASIIFSSMKKTNNSLSHLVPMGTPKILIPLMVIIELSSNMIRPMTMAIRLTANMVAGHILISLLEKMMINSIGSFLVSSAMMTTLLLLEMSVSMIQAYIFSILIILFSSENH